jgi:hypothetical protein
MVKPDVPSSGVTSAVCARRTRHVAHRGPLVLACLLVLLTAWHLLIARPLEVQTPAGVQGDRLRLMLGFRVRPDLVQQRLPPPWRLHPVDNGPLQGANFFVILVDRVRDDDAAGRPRARGANRIINFVAPATHPQKGQTASVILDGYASNPANVPGVFQAYRAATVQMEHTIIGHGADVEDVTDVWEVQEAMGPGRLELRLRTQRQLSAQTRERGEAQVLSARNPTLSQRHAFEAVAEVVKSVPEGTDRVQEYHFRLSGPEYRELFDGSEQLIGISVTSWYVRQDFGP